MAGELRFPLNLTGATIKACIVGPDGTNTWSGSGSAMNAIAECSDTEWRAGLVSCVERLTESGTGTKLYVGDMPPVPPGEYLIRAYSGATPSPNDDDLYQLWLPWNGAAAVSPLDAYELAWADQVLDTSTSPFELVYYRRGTLSELGRQKLYDAAGNALASINTIVGRATQ
jgi:hypothetical protein